MSVFTERNQGIVEPKVEETNRDTAPPLDIEEQARVRLQHSLYRAIRRVTCRFEDGVLSLEGHVPTFHYKQLAQTAVADIEGVKEVVNDVRVDYAP